MTGRGKIAVTGASGLVGKALVTALREVSVLFAVLIGIVFFGERADRGKLVAAGIGISVWRHPGDVLVGQRVHEREVRT